MSELQSVSEIQTHPGFFPYGYLHTFGGNHRGFGKRNATQSVALSGRGASTEGQELTRGLNKMVAGTGPLYLLGETLWQRSTVHKREADE